jgi:hypothetical protein
VGQHFYNRVAQTLNFRQGYTSLTTRLSTTLLLSAMVVLLAFDSLWFGFTHAKATAYLLTLVFSVLWDAAVYATIELILAGGAFLLGGAALVWFEPPETVLDVAPFLLVVDCGSSGKPARRDTLVMGFARQPLRSPGCG